MFYPSAAFLFVARAEALQERPVLSKRLEERIFFFDPAITVPFAAFEDDRGKEIQLRDFKGHFVVLNFWATWCAPCVREMPSLDRLQETFGDQNLKVLAISQDRGPLAAIEAFYRRLSLHHLPTYRDANSRLSRALEVSYIPMTYLIDQDSRIVGLIKGAYEFNEPDIRALIAYYQKQ